MSKAPPATPETMTKFYNVLRTPVITEKATQLTEHNQVVFKVDKDATKPMVKKAVETLFKVEVTKVTTQIIKGKKKRFRGIWGQQKSSKKAVVTLKEGHSIDVTVGV